MKTLCEPGESYSDGTCKRSNPGGDTNLQWPQVVRGMIPQPFHGDSSENGDDKTHWYREHRTHELSPEQGTRHQTRPCAKQEPRRKRRSAMQQGGLCVRNRPQDDAAGEHGNSNGRDETETLCTFDGHENIH